MYDDFERARHAPLVAVLAGHSEPVTAMAWSPDGQSLASTSVDGVLNVWSLIGTETRPRFQHKLHTKPAAGFTSVAWSPNGDFIACGDTGGQLEVYEAIGLRPVAYPEPGSRSSVTCVAWGLESGNGDLRLAFGAQDHRVHFRNFRNWPKPDMEVGIGHAWPIRALAWAPDGAAVFTGTIGGTIGIWRASSRSNELPWNLSWQGQQAHLDAVTALQFCPQTGALASGGRDGHVHLWDIKNERLLETLRVERGEEVLDLAFAPNGEVIVVQSLDHIRFIRRDPLRQIAAYRQRAALEPQSRIAVSSEAQLATVNAKDPTSIAVRNVDFHSIVRESELTRRPYRAVAVSLLGDQGSGRTNLALAMQGKAFVPQHQPHAFEAHRLPTPSATDAPELAEVREVVLWDLPTGVDHALIHRMHAGEGAVALMVLSPVPGTAATSGENIERWRKTIREWGAITRGAPQRSIVAITKCDEMIPSPDKHDALTVARKLGVERVIFTSARHRSGVGELTAYIVGAIDWEPATSFPSQDVLELIAEFVVRLRTRGRYLASTRELYDLFAELHPYALSHVHDEDTFRDGLQLLEVLGYLELFERRDEVILDPIFYHAYASALVAQAEEDPRKMGRVLLADAEMGTGLKLHGMQRLPDWKQEHRLLALTIHELISGGVAQRVGVDRAVYLVFPAKLAAPLEPSYVKPRSIGKVDFRGKTHDVYRSLVVGLLGLEDFYRDPYLRRDHAFFSTPSGGRLGISLDTDDAGDKGTLSVYCDDTVTAMDRAIFANRIRTHIRPGDPTMVMTVEEGPAAPGMGQHASESVEVYLCWDGEADRATRANVRQMASELRRHGLSPVGDDAVDAGLTTQEHLARLDRSGVALVLLGGEMSEAQALDVYRLEAAGCRIVPVFLPNAPTDLSLPSALLRWRGVYDFRGSIADIDTLASDVTIALKRGRLTKAHHAFLSYSRGDYAMAEGLVRQLEKAGHVIWWDRGHMQPLTGDDWEETIRGAIHQSYAFILCVSATLVKRPRSWVYPELSEAADVQKTLRPGGAFIMPVRLSECEIPDIDVGGKSLRKLQWFDFYTVDSSITALVGQLDEARRDSDAGSPG